MAAVWQLLRVFFDERILSPPSPAALALDPSLEERHLRWFFTFYAFLLPTVLFYATTAAFGLIDHYDLLAKYKIVKNKWPSRDLVKKALVKILPDSLIVYPFVEAFAIFPAARYLGMSLEVAQLPSPGAFLLQLVFCFLVTDLSFYSFHRLLHTRALYARIHKKHHEFKETISLSSLYAHPIEDMSNVLTVYLGPFILRAHAAVYLVHLLIRLVETLEVHSGYKFPISPFGNRTLFMGSEGHCFHHSVNIGCYGVTRLWDRLFGTDVNYVEWLQKQEAEEKLRKQ